MKRELRGRRVLVVGMERSGVGAARLLLNEGAEVTAADQRPFEQLGEDARALREQGVAYQEQSEGGFASFDLIVLSPGVPTDIPELLPARGAGVPAIGEVELAAPFLKGRTVGITGSNGKTTTTALTGHLFQAAGIPVQIGGNIGVPVTEMVYGSQTGAWNVLELSSFQLETIETFRPEIAALLNVTQNHLDRHHTFAEYAEAKGKIFDHQLSTDFAVLNAHDATGRSMGTRGLAKRVWFDSEHPADVSLQAGKVFLHGEALMDTTEIPIRGKHNHENAMAAIAIASLAGVPAVKIAEGIRTFRAVEHRLEYVETIRGVSFYNDSKATSVDATEKALGAFDRGLWVILGGKDKGSDYRPLRESLTGKTRGVLLIGSAAEKIGQQLGNSVEQIAAVTLENAVAEAYRRAQPGDTILLAPACASFDQFQNYEHRGRAFKDLVHAISRREHGTAA